MKELKPSYVWIIIPMLIGGFFYGIQSVPDFSALPLADHHHYLNFYNFFVNSSADFQVKFPFNQRPVIPWLSSLLPMNAASSFLLINSLFSQLAALVWIRIWKFLNLDGPKALFILGFCSLHFIGWFRNGIIDPVATDGAQVFIYSLALWLMLSRRFFWFIPFALIAVLIKESAIPLMAVVFLISLISTETNTKVKIYVGLGLILAILANILANRVFPGYSAPGSKSLFSVYIYTKMFFSDTALMLRWMVAFFTSFGTVFWFLGHPKFRFCFQYSQRVLGITALSIIALSIIGGQDYLRLLFFAVPLVFTFILLALPTLSKGDWLILLLFSIPWLKPMLIPDAVSANEKYPYFYTDYAPIEVIWPFLAFGFVGLIISLIYLKINNSVG
jgi:hypothetical protein